MELLKYQVLFWSLLANEVLGNRSLLSEIKLYSSKMAEVRSVHI